MNKPVKVLVVDDSALARKMLSDKLSQYHGIEVVGTAKDGGYVLQKIQEVKPDVITLDVEMRNISGLDILPEIIQLHQLPVIMVSAHTNSGAEATLKALEFGAVDFVAKPQSSGIASIDDIIEVLAQKIIMVSGTKIHKRNVTIQKSSNGSAHKRSLNAKLESHKLQNYSTVSYPAQPVEIIAIGASTGGTEAVKDVLLGLNPDLPGIIITQHMPAGFTTAFAKRLNTMCSLSVKEAETGDELQNGTVLIAPGGKHLCVKKRNGKIIVSIMDTDPVNRHKPSVDVMFDSVLECAGANTLAVILTGMGADGADGMKRLKDQGAFTIAQNEESCVVFGMPKEAINRGGVHQILPLQDISGFVNTYINRVHSKHESSTFVKDGGR